MQEWAEVHRLFYREKCSKADIAERLGMSRTSVHRLLALKEPPRYERDDRDRFGLHLGNIAAASFGAAAAANISSQILTVDGHDLARVHVKPSGFPVDAEVTVNKKGQLQKKTAFYIRLNNGTRDLDEQEKQKYIGSRWSGDSGPQVPRIRQLNSQPRKAMKAENYEGGSGISTTIPSETLCWPQRRWPRSRRENLGTWRSSAKAKIVITNFYAFKPRESMSGR